MTLALPPGSPSAHWPGALVPSTMPRFPVTVRFPGYNPTNYSSQWRPRVLLIGFWTHTVSGVRLGLMF